MPHSNSIDSKTTPLSPSRSRSRSHSQSLCRSPVHPGSPAYTRRGSRHSISPQREAKRDKRRTRYDHNSREDEDYHGESREYNESQAREISAHSSPQRSTHRNLRDDDKEPSRSKHRSHRSHRNRTRSPDRPTRGSRKRSRTPELRISGASRRVVDDEHHRKKDADEGRPSRKRRQREDDGYEYDRKRSRRHKEPAAEDTEPNYRTKHVRGEERESRRESKAWGKLDETSVEPPKSPKVDQHALEREARNRERQMKEIQRRAVMDGKSTGSRSKVNGRHGERRASYKYEDEDLTSRVEKERESDRWG